MFKFARRILAAAVVIAAASAPSIAYARVNLDPLAPTGTAGNVQSLSSPSVQRASVSSPQSFQWGDAAIGAAGVIILVSVGSGGVIAHRRRATDPLTS